MPTYLSPGVYVEEVPAGTQPIEGVGTSTGAFVGVAERGTPDVAKLITNYTQFVNEFGRHVPGYYLAYAVFSFFAEGGTSCYVTRVSGTGADAATVTVNGSVTTNALKFDATSVGAWGNRVTVEFSNPGNESSTTHFRLTVTYNETVNGQALRSVEVFDDVAADTVAAAVNGSSAYVIVSTPTTTGTLAERRPANTTTPTSLASGDDSVTSLDYIGTSADQKGLHSFDVIDDINIVAIPDLAGNRAKIIDALNYCELRKDCFFLVDPPVNITPSAAREFKQGTGSYSGNLLNSSYGALYYPWVIVNDPLTGGTIKVPPSGLIAGSFANTDSTRGVHKAPAGTIDGFLNSAVGIERQVTKGEQDVLNPGGVNVIRTFPQSGIVIWGARTLSNIPEFRYVPVRRLLLFLEESIDEGSQFVVFEPNDPTLWGKVRRTLTAFLTRVWRDGALFGATPEEAFFVKVDEENNPAIVRDAGQLIIEVGVAPVKPAEFVIIRVAQKTAAIG